MKTIEYYMKLPYRLEIVSDPDEGGYAARYPDLPGCLTVGETMMSALENAEDAKRVWLEAALEDGIEIAEPAGLEDYSGQLLPQNNTLLLSAYFLNNFSLKFLIFPTQQNNYQDIRRDYT